MEPIYVVFQNNGNHIDETCRTKAFELSGLSKACAKRAFEDFSNMDMIGSLLAGDVHPNTCKYHRFWVNDGFYRRIIPFYGLNSRE